MIPHDMKAYGREPTMPRSIVNLCLGLCAVIVLLLAYSVVSDIPDRVVVMSRATFDAHVAAERIKAAQDVMDAVGTCGWRDLFYNEPKIKRGMM